MTQITVPAVPIEVTYAVTSASTGPFTVPFPFFDEDDVFATVTDALGAVTALVHTTDFTFSVLTVPVGQEGTGYEGGALDLNVAIGADGATTLRIYRSTVVDRTANFPSTGPFSMPILNDEQNQQTMIMQELEAEIAAVDAANLSIDGTDIMAGNLNMGGYDIDNVATVAADAITIGGILISTTAVSGVNIEKTYLTVAGMLAAVDIAVGNTVSTQGYTAAGDGGGATYRIVAAATGTDDGGLYHDLTGITGQAELLHAGHVNLRQYGAVGDGVADDTSAFNKCVLAATQAAGFNIEVQAGTYLVSAVSVPSTGALTITGAGRDVVTIQGDAASNFLSLNGNTRISGVRITNYLVVFDVVGTGDIYLYHNKIDTSTGMLTGTINAEIFDIRYNILYTFSSYLILESSTTLTKASYFIGNDVRDIARYVYRLQHDACLYFLNNRIDDIHNDGFVTTAAVCRIVMRGSAVTNYIQGNYITNVISTDEESLLIYWSLGSVICTGNTFGKFQSVNNQCYLIKQKSSGCKHLIVANNYFLGDADKALWASVCYILGDASFQESPCYIGSNIFVDLYGHILIMFQDIAANVMGDVIVESNYMYNFDQGAFVSLIQGGRNVTVRGNVCLAHVNVDGNVITGTVTAKAIVVHYVTASYGIASNIVIENNQWNFETTGETAGPYTQHLLYTRFFNAAAGQTHESIVRNNIVSNADGFVGGINSGTANGVHHISGNIARGGLANAVVDATAATKLLMDITTEDNWEENSYIYSKYGVTATTAELEDITDDINLFNNKQEGYSVFNSTTNKPVYAVGNLAADVWVDGTGATVHTPV